MNKPIRRIAFLAMLMFALLLANGTYLTVVRQDSLDANPYNRRVRDEEFAQDRGPILVGSTAIASTKPSDDRFRYQRVYSDGPLYAPITGFFSYDHGSSNLESSYNSELAGTDGALFVRRLIDTVTNKAPQGATVQTTIDAAAQEAAAKALGDQKGAVVALDPTTGAVLAMVTSPSYDPNKIASHDVTAADRAYDTYIKASGSPMSNRAAREIYPPGSTFKLVTAAAALADGRTPDTMIDSPSRLRLPGTTTYLPNENNCGGTRITLTRALDVSCNTAFANLGLSLGQDKLRAQAKAFGFDARHLDDVGGAASQFPDDLNPSQLALSSIGQFDVAASPLQMAMVSAAIANDGKLMDPYLVSTVRGPDLSVIDRHTPTELSQPMTEQNARALQQMMVSVVQQGTGGNGAISGVEVGGKTGTAQSDPNRKPFAWYTSFARSGDKSVAVAVVVEDADIPRQDIAGGRVAAPIARATMQAVLG